MKKDKFIIVLMFLVLVSCEKNKNHNNDQIIYQLPENTRSYISKLLIDKVKKCDSNYIHIFHHEGYEMLLSLSCWDVCKDKHIKNLIDKTNRFFEIDKSHFIPIVYEYDNLSKTRAYNLMNCIDHSNIIIPLDYDLNVASPPNGNE